MNIFDRIWDALSNLVDGNMSDVDLASKLDETNVGRNLDWRESIVDLMKLLGLDSSSESRKELAVELGVVGTFGDATFNEELRKKLFKRIAERGGNVPANLLD